MCLGMNMPAVYLNPVLASAQLLGCSDRDAIEHVTVYWIGPLCGASVAVYTTFCSQAMLRKLCRPCVTFEECPSSTECSQPCRPSPDKNNCEVCDSKSRSNSSRPCRCSCETENDDIEGECCEDAEPSACRPSGCGITAQVRQTALNGSKQLAYLFDIPPTVCRKGLRLRHNILVTKKKPRCESSDLCSDDWRTDSTGNGCDWRRNPRCPFPTSRDTSPECSPEDWRRSGNEGRDESCSPGRVRERIESEDDRKCSVSRRQSRADDNAVGSRKSKQDAVRIKSTRTLAVDNRRSHSRRSVGKGDSRRSSPRASQSRESQRRRHSQHTTTAGKKSHSHADHRDPRASSRAASRQSHAGVVAGKSAAGLASQVSAKKSQAAQLSQQKSAANTKALSKAKSR